MYKAIGFDLGGVIIEYAIPRWMEFASERLGVKQAALELAYARLRPLVDTGEISNHQFWARLVKDCGSQVDPAGTEHLWNDNYIAENPFITGMLDLVDRLKTGGYRVGLLSNIDFDHGSINKTRGITEHFDVALFSNEIKARKPEPAAFARLAEALRVQMDELIFIDDLPENAAGARAAGAYGILFEGYQALVDELKLVGVRV
ncbi:MAG TPA: HAD family phosphatase [Candidatus Saccharimonadales bacterium]|nr:HAD family phosphatase [Candidatus Saccharimonadales bacterium]